MTDNFETAAPATSDELKGLNHHGGATLVLANLKTTVDAPLHSGHEFSHSDEETKKSVTDALDAKGSDPILVKVKTINLKSEHKAAGGGDMATC